MGQITTSRRNLLILLGFLIPTLSNSKRFPNELFFEEFDFQRTSANQPSAIDQRDAVRLVSKNPASTKQTTSDPYSYHGDPPLHSRRSMSKNHDVTRLRKRVLHIEEPKFEKEDHWNMEDGFRNYRDFSGASVEINPKDLIYKSERIKRRNKENSKGNFKEKERILSQHSFFKRSGDIAPSSQEDISDESEDKSPAKDTTPFKTIKNQNDANSEKSPPIRNQNNKEVIKVKQETGQTNLKNSTGGELIKKKRRKVLRVRNRQKNNQTNAGGLNLNASFDNLKKEINNPLTTPVFYENKEVETSTWARNKNNSKSHVKNKHKTTTTVTSVPSNKTSQRTWKEKDYSRTAHIVNEKSTDEEQPESEFDALKITTASKRERLNKSKARTQNAKTTKDKVSRVPKVTTNKTSQHVWKEKEYSKKSHDVEKTIKKTSPNRKSNNHAPKTQYPSYVPSNKTVNKITQGEEYLRSPIDISELEPTSEYEYNKDTQNSIKNKAETTTSSLPSKQSSQNPQKHEEHTVTSYHKDEEESFYVDENPREKSKPKTNLKPEWIPTFTTENVSDSGDEHFFRSFNYKGDEVDQPKDVIKLNSEASPKGLSKKAQAFPDKKKTSVNSEKSNSNKDKKKAVFKKTPAVENLDFSKRFKVLNNDDDVKEYNRETAKINDYADDHNSQRLNTAAPVSYKKKTKKQPIEAVWKPAKSEEKTKNEQIQDSRSKSRGHFLNENGLFNAHDYNSPYPNMEDDIVDKSPKHVYHKEERPVNKETVVKSSFGALPKSQPTTPPKDNGKYFMTMFKRMGDISIEDFNSDGSKAAKGEGYLSSIKLSWDDDDTRAHVETSVDSRRQPFLFNRHNNNEYFNTEQDSIISELTKNEQYFGNEARVPSRNKPSKRLKTGENVKHKVAKRREKRSADDKNNHFFSSHFTLGKGGPSYSIARIHREPFIAVSESKDIKKTSEVQIPVVPTHSTASRFHKVNLHPERKPDKLSSPEVTSYFMRPMDSKAIEQHSKDFNTKETFPFDSYEKPARDTKIVEKLKSPQTSKRVINHTPKPKFNYSNVKEKKNGHLFPRARNIQTIKHTNVNSSKPFFYHSYSSVPSEPEVTKSFYIPNPSFEKDTKERTEISHQDANENVPSYLKGQTFKPTTTPKHRKLKERRISSDPQDQIETPRYQHYHLSNERAEPQEKSNKNVKSLRTAKRTDSPYGDLEKLAETQHYIAEDYDDPSSYQYPSKYSSAYSKPKSTNTLHSFEKNTWGQDFQSPEPRNSHPNYHTIPETHFQCKGAGYYADPEAGCQVFHMCQASGKKHSFLCPNNTLFNQQLLVCDWQNKVNCENSESHYNVNDRIYSSESKDDDKHEHSKWNTQHSWSYTNEFPKINDVSGRSNTKINEPEIKSSYTAFSKRHQNKLEDEDKSRSVTQPSVRRSSVTTAMPLYVSPTNTPQTSGESSKNSNYKFTFNTIKTTLKPSHRNKMELATPSKKRNLTTTYSAPREYDYWKEQGYSLVHDITTPFNKDKSPIIKSSDNSENKDKKSSWDSSKLKQSLQHELKSTADSRDEFKVPRSSSPNNFVKKSYPPPHATLVNKKTSHETQIDSTTILPQKEDAATTRSHSWPQERNANQFTTFRIAKVKQNATKSPSSNNQKRPSTNKKVEKNKPSPIVRTVFNFYPVQNNTSLFDGKVLEEKKLVNSQNVKEKKQKIFKFGNLPHTGVTEKQRKNDSLQDSNQKFRYPVRPNTKKIQNTKVTEYKYPITELPIQTDPSKDVHYGERIDVPKNVSAKKANASKMDQEKLKRDTERRKTIKATERVSPPKLNITSRIKDIMSGIENIGSDVSRILDGKDHLYKNIQIHKMKPTKSTKVNLSSKSLSSAKHTNTTNTLNHRNKVDTRTQRAEKASMTTEYYPEFFSSEIIPKKHSKSKSLDNIQATISQTTHLSSDVNSPTEIPTTNYKFKKASSERSTVQKNDSLAELQKSKFPKIDREIPNIEYASYKYNDGLEIKNKSKTNPVEIKKKIKNPVESFQYFNLNPTEVLQGLKSHRLSEHLDVETKGYKQNDKLNIKNNAKQNIEKQIQNPLESFQYFNLNSTEIQPEFKSHRLSDQLDDETASESRESLREIRYLPAPWTTTETFIPSVDTKDKTEQHQKPLKINIERSSFNKKQTPLDIDHVMIPKHIFQAALSGKNVQQKVLISKEIPDSEETHSYSSRPLDQLVNNTQPKLMNTYNKAERFPPVSRNAHSYTNLQLKPTIDSEEITDNTQSQNQALNNAFDVTESTNKNKAERLFPESRKAHSYTNLQLNPTIDSEKFADNTQSKLNNAYDVPVTTNKYKAERFFPGTHETHSYNNAQLNPLIDSVKNSDNTQSKHQALHNAYDVSVSTNKNKAERFFPESRKAHFYTNLQLNQTIDSEKFADNTQSKHQALNNAYDVTESTNKNKDERFLPGSHKAHSYTNLQLNPVTDSQEKISANTPSQLNNAFDATVSRNKHNKGERFLQESRKAYPFVVNLQLSATNGSEHFSDNTQTKSNQTANNFNRNKAERFLPGSRSAHSYINLPRNIVRTKPKSVRYQAQSGTEYRSPSLSSKQIHPAFIFTTNPFADQPLLHQQNNLERKPYLVVERPTRPASILQHTASKMSEFNQVPGEHELNANNNSEEDEVDCTWLVLTDDVDPSNLHLRQDGRTPSENDKREVYTDGRTSVRQFVQDGLRQNRPRRCRKKNTLNLPPRDTSDKGTSKHQTLPNRESLVDSFVKLPKTPRYRNFADFEKDSPHSQSISKISDILRERGQLPPKPVKLFEGHELLRPVISTEFVSKNARVPSHYRSTESSEESSRDSRRSSEEYNANRNPNYSHLEKAAEMKAEEMIKSKSSSS